LIACNKDDDFVPSAKVDKESLQLTYSGGVDSFAITSNTDWKAEKDADWVTLLPASGNGDAVIKVTVAENTVTTPRSATITVKITGLDDIKITVTQSKALETVGLYILSEGYTGNPDNTGSISYYDVKTGELTKNYFSRADGKPLGDGVNDLAIYGSNLYCVVLGGFAGTPGTEGYIEVINSENGTSKRRIPVTKADGTNGEPRRIVFHEGKAYVSTYSNSVIRIDTASLEIDKTITLTGGTYAEDLCLYNNNLYICNSGWGSGNTISVVNLSSFSEETITVPQNPVDIEATPSGAIYFTTADVSWAGGGPSNLYILDPEQKKVSHTFDIRASKIALTNDFIYATDFSWTDYSDYISKINLQTKAVSDISNIYEKMMVYSVSANPLTGDIYLGNQGDDVVAYDKDGKEKLSLKTGKACTLKVVPVIK
jgi:hypothetical protein